MQLPLFIAGFWELIDDDERGIRSAGSTQTCPVGMSMLRTEQSSDVTVHRCM